MKEITNSGWGVVVISATKLSTDGNHDHGQLDLSSLKGSGEIYFQLEVCYVLIKSIKGVHATCAKLVLHHDVMCIADKLGVFTPLCNLRSFDFGHVKKADPEWTKTLKQYRAIVLHKSSGKGGCHQETGKGITNRYRINFKMTEVKDDKWEDFMELSEPAIKADRP